MRLLVLYQAKNPAKDHPGYFCGFERLVGNGQLEAHVPLAFIGGAESKGWDGFWNHAYQTAARMGAEAIFLQFFHWEMPNPEKAIRRLKNLPSKPVLFSSLGDPFGRWTKRIPRSFKVASALSDVSFLTGTGYLARQLAANGSKNLVLMPLGCCQVRFSAPPPPLQDQPEFDVTFVGNRMRGRNPINHFYWVARRRNDFVTAMTKRYGLRFGLFGKGWEGNPAWQGPIPYVAQHAAYQRSAVVLGGTPNADHDYYTSDRPFIAATSGVPLVDYQVRGVERILEPERDWWLARDLDEMIRMTDRLLDLSCEERSRMAAETRRRVLATHTQYHRCTEMVETVDSVRAARRGGYSAPPPQLKFLSAANRAAQQPEAVVAWRG
jgi:hypothetical protein